MSTIDARKTPAIAVCLPRNWAWLFMGFFS
jgi:hypothetical protein